MSNYFCPRCNNPNIVICDNSFKCNECGLEFSKKDFVIIKDKSNILSIEEKIGIAEVLKNYKRQRDQEKLIS